MLVRALLHVYLCLAFYFLCKTCTYACDWGEVLTSALVFQALKRCSLLSFKNNLRIYLAHNRKLSGNIEAQENLGHSYDMCV